MEARMGMQIATRLRTCFLLQQRDILLERQGGAIESLDRELFDPGGAVPVVKLLVSRLQHTRHAVACQLSADVILPVIDAHASIGLHAAGKGPLMHPPQPAVRIDALRKAGQRGKLWAGHTWWLVATGARLVGTLVVGMSEKGLGGLADLFVGARQVDQQAFLTERAMKSLDRGVEVWTMRRDERSAQRPHTRGSAPARKGNRVRMGCRRSGDRSQR